MAVTAGSVWVQGDYLHFAASTTTNYRYLGTYVANRSPGIAGSIWIDGANLRYLDSANNERYLPLGAASTPGGVTSAINGSVWIENNRLNSVEGSTKQKREYHVDVAHTDIFTDAPDHDDVAFSNVPHGDDYIDTHTDTSNFVQFFNSHGDIQHWDDSEYYIEFLNSHSDTPSFYDHYDGSQNIHTDISHGDQVHFDVAHGDNPFTNVSFVSQPEFVGNI